MHAYNRAIDRLNETDTFHDALVVIDDIRATYETENNKAAVNGLLKIVKRKFH